VEKLAFFSHTIAILAKGDHVLEAHQLPAHRDYRAVREVIASRFKQIFGNLERVHDNHGFPKCGDRDEIACVGRGFRKEE
jgi:hypothetical protein